MQPFLPHSPLFDHLYNQSLQFIGQHKEGSCPKSPGGKPKKAPWRCLQPLSSPREAAGGYFSAEVWGGHSSAGLHSFPSTAGALPALFKKWKEIKSSVGREGAWIPSIWPLKTFPQHLLLSQQNKSKAAESSGQQPLAGAVSGGQHCPARFLCSFKADLCLYLLGCSRILHGMSPTFPPRLAPRVTLKMHRPV